MTTQPPSTIDEYISGFPEKTQQLLGALRATIHAAVPGLQETISYAIPAFTLGGHFVIYFAGYKNHIGLYPAPREVEAFAQELARYKGGKGSVQFPLDQPLPADLVTRMVQYRAGKITAGFIR